MEDVEPSVRQVDIAAMVAVLAYLAKPIALVLVSISNQIPATVEVVEENVPLDSTASMAVAS